MPDYFPVPLHFTNILVSMAPFGPDVFNNPKGTGTANGGPSGLPVAPLTAGIPLGAVVAVGGLFALRRLRSGRAHPAGT